MGNVLAIDGGRFNGSRMAIRPPTPIPSLAGRGAAYTNTCVIHSAIIAGLSDPSISIVVSVVN